MSAEKRNQFQDMIEGDMLAKPLLKQIESDFDVNVFQTKEEDLPETDTGVRAFHANELQAVY